MSTKQKIILAAITLAVAVIEISQGIAETIFGAAIAFGITYFFIYRYNRRANMTPEEKAAIRVQKERRSEKKRAIKNAKQQARLVHTEQRAKQQARLVQKNEQLKLKEEKRHNLEQEKIAKSKAQMEKAEATIIRCSSCNNKTNKLTRIKFADGFLCGKCLKQHNLKDTFGLRSWAKTQSWKDAEKYHEVELEMQQTMAEIDRPHCPNCGSTNIQPLGQHRKGFSVGKAVGGAVLTGGVGTLAGFAGKNTKKTTFVCMDCGKQFIR